MGIKLLLEMLRVFFCEAYAYNQTHRKQMVLYASKLRHIGVAADSKGWLLWDPQSWKFSTSILVQFNESKPLVTSSELPDIAPDESIILAIECVQLGDFTLSNELDTQDSLVNSLQTREAYSNDSPTYGKAMN